MKIFLIFKVHLQSNIHFDLMIFSKIAHKIEKRDELVKWITYRQKVFLEMRKILSTSLCFMQKSGWWSIMILLLWNCCDGICMNMGKVRRVIIHRVVCYVELGKVVKEFSKEKQEECERKSFVWNCLRFQSRESLLKKCMLKILKFYKINNELRIFIVHFSPSNPWVIIFHKNNTNNGFTSWIFE